MYNEPQDLICSTVKSEQNTKPTSNQRKAWFTNERLNLFLALCAIIISAASFYTTYLQANAQQGHGSKL